MKGGDKLVDMIDWGDPEARLWWGGLLGWGIALAIVGTRLVFWFRKKKQEKE